MNREIEEIDEETKLAIISYYEEWERKNRVKNIARDVIGYLLMFVIGVVLVFIFGKLVNM